MSQSGYDNLRGICENVSKRYVTAVLTEKCFNRAVFDYILYEKRNIQYVAISHCQLITILIQLTTLQIFVMICALLSIDKNKDDWLWSLNHCVQDFTCFTNFLTPQISWMWEKIKCRMSSIKCRRDIDMTFFIKCRGLTRHVECRWTLNVTKIFNY